jgi:type VI secretion system protein ImpA
LPAIDTDSLLEDISPDAPAGSDLSYSADYLELMRFAEGTPEQQMGDTIIPAEEPNWRDVRDRCVELLGKTRDLRLIVIAAAAGMATEGIPGLAEGLRLLRGTVERHWGSVFPQLDPEDDNDPLERLNIIAGIAAPPETFGDTLKFRRKVREAPLSNSRQLGRYSLRDIAIAAGEGGGDSNGDSQATVSMAMIDGAFEDTPVEDLQAISAAAALAIEHVRATEQALDGLVGGGNAPNLEGLRKDLGDICSCLDRYLARRGYGAAAEQEAAEGGGAPTGGNGSAVRSVPGEIASPQDVLLAIDRICQYYDRHEPSSPVPILLKRAKRLVSKSFLDIIGDLSPDALDQIKALGGIVDVNE